MVKYTHFAPGPNVEYHQMKAALPPMGAIENRVRSHRDIYMGDLEFFKMFSYCPQFRAFCKNTLQSRNYWFNLLNELHYDAGDTHFDITSLHLADDYIEPRSGINPENLDLFIYPRIDIGYGVVGYGLENGGQTVHIDMPHRIVSSVLYLTDQSRLEGGEIEVWNSPTEMKERFPLEENMMLSILQDQNGWHRVNPVTRADEPRIAIYMALSCTKNIWRYRQ